MTVRLNPTYFSSLLSAVFSDQPYPAISGYQSVIYAMLCGGVQPESPSVTAGITVFQSVVISSGKWLPPGDGVSMLSSPIVFTPTASGSITFLRLTYAVASNSGIVDIPIGLAGSGASAVVSSLVASSGVPVSVTDVRVKFNTAGSFSVGAVLANEFLSSLLMADRGNSMRSTQAASRFDSVSNGYTRAVTVNVYDGTIPSHADNPATGIKLWTKSITSNNLFTVNGVGMSLFEALTANAIASGAPTYLRVVKAAYTGLNYQTGVADSWPATVFQLPIGPPTNGCIMTPGVLVSGQSATITNMTVTLQP